MTYHSPNSYRDVDFDFRCYAANKTHVVGNLRVGLVAGNFDEGELAVLSAKSGGAGGLSGEEGDGDGLDDGHGCLFCGWLFLLSCGNYVRKNGRRVSEDSSKLVDPSSKEAPAADLSRHNPSMRPARVGLLNCK